MNVYLSLESLAAPRTGIGYYSQHLISHLIDDHSDLNIKGVLGNRLVEQKEIEDLLKEAEEPAPSSGSSSFIHAIKPFVRAVPGAYSARQALRSRQHQRVLEGGGQGVFHEPNFIPPKTNSPTVITVHDVSHMRHPEYHPTERVRFLNNLLPKALKRADRIVTVSNFTKNELCHFFPEIENKTTAIHLGVEEDFRVRSWRETADVLSPMGLMHGTYILAAATQEPRKNLAGLVRSYLKLPLHIRKQTPLVLVGGSGWKNKALLKALADAREEDSRVIVTGRVSRHTLTNLMSGARLFAYPSFYEGFGLPIAEARASGVPVLTTNHGAMKEVAGNDAILVDPNDFVEPMKAFLEAPNYEAEPFRFDWSETARKTADVYRNAFI